MNKKDCVFCNFKDTEVQLYQDSVCYAVISKNPINKYHVLVIPLEHYKDFVELPDKLASHLFLVAKKISKAVRKVSSPEAITHVFDDDISKSGINLVGHFKFHIFPRFKKDIQLIDWRRLRTEESNLARSKDARDIKKQLIRA